MKKTGIIIALPLILIWGAVAFLAYKVFHEPPIPPLSEDEAREFAGEIEALVRNGDGNDLYKKMGRRALTERVLGDDIELAWYERRRKRDELASAIKVGGRMSDWWDGVADYELLKLEQEADGFHVLYRLNKGSLEEGFDYHEMVLARAPDGQPVIADIYRYRTSAWIGEAVRRDLYELMPSIAPEDEIPSKTAQLNMEQIPRIAQQAAMGQHEEAQRLFDAMLPEVKELKEVRHLKMVMANKKGDPEAFAAAFEEYKAAYPDDPALDLLIIEKHLAKEEWAQMAEAVENLDKAVGGDVFLNLLRAFNLMLTALDEDGEGVTEELSARVVTLLEPLLAQEKHMDAHELRLMLAVRAEDHAETLNQLRIMKKLFGAAPGIDNMPEYAKFRRSPEYRTWTTELEADALRRRMEAAKAEAADKEELETLWKELEGELTKEELQELKEGFEEFMKEVEKGKAQSEQGK